MGNEDIRSEILAAEFARCAAMRSNDAATLDALLDPRLSFSHATGQVDDKPAYCTKMAAGRIEYLNIIWAEQQVTELSDTAALLTGRMTSHVRVEGIEKNLNNRVLAAWSKSGSTWRLVAFQSTPLKQ